MLDCGKCGKPVDGSTCPFCGYSEMPATSAARERDPDWWRCSHEDRGQRCASSGRFASGTNGYMVGSKARSGPWFCGSHMPAMQRFEDGKACPPPMGFAALKALVSRPVKPYDFEAEAERIALQHEPVTQ